MSEAVCMEQPRSLSSMHHKPLPGFPAQNAHALLQHAETQVQILAQKQTPTAIDMNPKEFLTIGVQKLEVQNHLNRPIWKSSNMEASHLPLCILQPGCCCSSCLTRLQSFRSASTTYPNICKNMRKLEQTECGCCESVVRSLEFLL